MKVTDADVIRVAGMGSMNTLASAVLANRHYLSGIAVRRKLICSAIRLVDPVCGVDGRRFSLFHPVERSMGQVIEEAISNKIALTVGSGDA